MYAFTVYSKFFALTKFFYGDRVVYVPVAIECSIRPRFQIM